MSVSRPDIARAAMQELAALHPGLTMQQMMLALQEAEWDWDANPITVKFRLPNEPQDIKLEIDLAKTDD